MSKEPEEPADEEPGDTNATKPGKIAVLERCFVLLVGGMFRLADRNRIWSLVVLCIALDVGIFGYVVLDKLPPGDVIPFTEKVITCLGDLLMGKAIWGWIFAVVGWGAFGILYQSLRRRIDELADSKRTLENQLMGGKRASSRQEAQNE